MYFHFQTLLTKFFIKRYWERNFATIKLGEMYCQKQEIGSEIGNKG